MSYFLVYLRYFKRKAEKESQRKKKAGESDDEISEKETNFGIVLFMVEIFVCELCFIVSRFTFNLSVLFTDNVLEERSSFEYDFARYS